MRDDAMHQLSDVLAQMGKELAGMSVTIGQHTSITVGDAPGATVIGNKIVMSDAGGPGVTIGMQVNVSDTGRQSGTALAAEAQALARDIRADPDAKSRVGQFLDKVAPYARYVTSLAALLAAAREALGRLG